jgi:outer membrane protein TolC
MFTMPLLNRLLMGSLFLLAAIVTASGQTGPEPPSAYSIATPRPISPAEGTTTPSARITQRQNPYLGSVPTPTTGTRLTLSLQDAIARGLRFNLGLIESTQASADVRAERLRSLSLLLPQVSAHGRQAWEDISFAEIGLKLPSTPGVPQLPPTTGGYGYQDARLRLTQSVYDAALRNQYRAQNNAEQASVLDARDARDVVVFAVGVAYMQVMASSARLATAQAQLTSARELDQQVADDVKAEVSPEIDSLRAQVERQSAEQRVTNAGNQLEKDKLALARIIGLSVEQEFVTTDVFAHGPLTALSYESAKAEALQLRADLASAMVGVNAAEYALRAKQSQRLPSVSVNANYGGAGTNVGNFNTVYAVYADISLPIYTGGRIRADIQQAQAGLARRQAEYEDLKGRVAYDVRVAWLDVSASESSVKVAERNQALAQRELKQSQDRYSNGVTNYLEVVQAQETVAAANENYIQSLFSFNVATIALARAMGNTDATVQQLLGDK